MVNFLSRWIKVSSVYTGPTALSDFWDAVNEGMFTISLGSTSCTHNVDRTGRPRADANEKSVVCCVRRGLEISFHSFVFMRMTRVRVNDALVDNKSHAIDDVCCPYPTTAKVKPESCISSAR